MINRFYDENMDKVKVIMGFALVELQILLEKFEHEFDYDFD